MNNNNLLDNYLTLTLWYVIHKSDSRITKEQFELVLEEINKIKDRLLSEGVSQRALTELDDYVDKITKTPIEELSRDDQLRICKVVFGQGTHWADED